jgi:hypothetical protein
MILEFIQRLTEMNTKGSFWGKARQARTAENLTATLELTSSTSQDPIGLHGLLQG